jgi:hypothetical protein
VPPPPAPPAPPPAPPRPASPGGLGQAPDWQARAIDAKAERVGEIFQGVAAKSDGRSDWYIPLVQGRCYLFSGVGDATIEKLYFFLWDPQNSRVDTVKPYGAMVVSRYCAPTSGSYHVQLKVAEGNGAYALGTYAVAGPATTVPVDLEELGRARVAAAVAGALPYGTPLVLAPGAGKANWSLNLGAGSCLNGTCARSCGSPADCPTGYGCDTLVGAMEKANGGKLSRQDDDPMLRAASAAAGRVCYRVR